MFQVVPILAAVAMLSSAVIAAASLTPVSDDRWGFLAVGLPVLAGAFVALGAALGLMGGMTFADHPAFLLTLHGGVPLVACFLGGSVAAAAFCDLSGSSRLAHRYPTGVAASLLACGIPAAGFPGISSFVSVVGVPAFLAALLGARFLSARNARRLMLISALCLLWSGAFLVYLSVFPSTVVGGEGDDSGGVSLRQGMDALVVALPLAVAFLLGFLKRQRG